MQGNGKGYCANSRRSPLLCGGDSGQTCLLCGRVKGGERGCWARGCRSGEAPESLTEAALRNRISNVRTSQRAAARKQNAARLAGEAQEAQALRLKGDAVAAKGLRSCLRKGKRGLPEARSVCWGMMPAPKAARVIAQRLPFGEDFLQPATAAVPKKPYGTRELRQSLWWQGAGATVECEGCGARSPRADVPLQREPGRSVFCRTVGLCEKCQPQDFVFLKK